METPWYKENLSNLYKKLDAELNTNSPLNNFRNINLSFDNVKIPKMTESFIKVTVVMGTLRRIEETAYIWNEEIAKSAVFMSNLLCSLYICIVYPQERFLVDLYENLYNKTKEKELLSFLTTRKSCTRFIRNSLSHGSYEFKKNGIEFRDKKSKKKKEYSFTELEIITLHVFNVFMTCFEIQNRIKMEKTN